MSNIVQLPLDDTMEVGKTVTVMVGVHQHSGTVTAIDKLSGQAFLTISISDDEKCKMIKEFFEQHELSLSKTTLNGWEMTVSSDGNRYRVTKNGDKINVTKVRDID